MRPSPPQSPHAATCDWLVVGFEAGLHPVVARLRDVAVAPGVLALEPPGRDPAASARDSARWLARQVDRVLLDSAPEAVLVTAPPWWAGIALQRRALGLGAAPRWIVRASDGDAGTPARREACVRAWLSERSQALADAVLPVPRPGEISLPPEALAGGGRAWLESLPHGGRAALARQASAPPVWIGIVIVHHDRPALLGQALDSLARQSRPADALVVVDAATPGADARAGARDCTRAMGRPRARWVAAASASLGAARALGVGALIQRGAPADGWVLFMDDDNVAAPDALALFARAAASGGADLWTCWAALFQGEAPPPAGADPERASLYAPPGPVPGLLDGPANPAGDANMLMRLAAFRSLGGFDPDPTVAAEDWDLLARAAVLGLAQAVVPRVLVWKRLTPGAMSARMSMGPARARVRDRLRAAGVPT